MGIYRGSATNATNSTWPSCSKKHPLKSGEEGGIGQGVVTLDSHDSLLLEPRATVLKWKELLGGLRKCEEKTSMSTEHPQLARDMNNFLGFEHVFFSESLR